jgi:uncharacterized protein YndB with AHSA1/START domain
VRTVFKLLPLWGALLLVGLWAAARALPESLTVARSLSVDAPVARVYPVVADLHRWPAWLIGPDVRVDVHGTGRRPGSRLTIDFPDADPVTVELTATSSPTGVDYRHWTEDPADAVEGTIRLRGSDPVTVEIEERVTLGGSAQRWMGWALGDVMMGQVLERELHNLKSYVETGRTHSPDGGAP